MRRTACCGARCFANWIARSHISPGMGAVADFFFLHTTLPVGPLANYVFNLADVAITLGVALLLFESFIVPPPADVSTT